MQPDGKDLLSKMFRAAVAAADPEYAIQRYLPARPAGRTIVVGAGKASSQMAASLERHWDGPLEGLVVTPYGSAARCNHIEVVEASHPVPDAAGLAASHRLLSMVSELTEDDLVIALISGGGSALLPAPPAGLTLADEIAVNEALLASGAPISSMNIVRKHLSLIKGGHLAARAFPAKVVTLVVSDVPGDDPAFVSSGPTIPGPGAREEALQIVSSYRIDLPTAALQHLQSSTTHSPHPSDAIFFRNEAHVIASARISLNAAVELARYNGIEARILSDSIEGEARHIGGMHAALAREVARYNQPLGKPVLLLSGGETTVTLRSKGRGGRNTEFLLALALGIQGVDGITALAADTDGIDGSERSAGAFADGYSIERMQRLGIDARTELLRHNSWVAFDAIGDLFSTGPTGTNVNDFRAILVR